MISMRDTFILSFKE